ncbi:MAG: inorganic phosphate transporter [Methylacidiphilales bacterium]|nr:inorganic phosphate transporter [Candidatus Methylacidiphilales bacterium]
MELFGETLTFAGAFFLLLALALALCFEFVNGFHDTANAVATVIYTHSLKPVYAVIWSGCWNLIGVVVSSGLVAYSIIGLLPHDIVANVGTGSSAGVYTGFAMIFSLLISAIIWNLGTWYLGLPASSTHTLIGSILGVGVANAVMQGNSWTAGLNWDQIYKVILALAVSPLVGFGVSALLLLILKLILKLIIPSKELFKAPNKGETPPLWIRGTLIGTCTGVSYAHGYNDGQKGMGLIMLILIAVLPGAFALQSPADPGKFKATVELCQKASVVFQSQVPTAPVTPAPVTPAVSPAAPAPDIAVALRPKLGSQDQVTLNQFVKTGKATAETYQAFDRESAAVAGELQNIQKFEELPSDQRANVRKDIYLLVDALGKLNKTKLIKDKDQAKTVADLQTNLQSYTQYIPLGVKLAVALALGLGTMVGWKRIVVTVGEKIGKAHLTYGQGASAELVAFVTVLGAGLQGWPVSTTHVLSSGIAGTMAANRSGLQTKTLINIVLAWVLTLPVCIFLGASLFSASLYVVFHVLGVH